MHRHAQTHTQKQTHTHITDTDTDTHTHTLSTSTTGLPSPRRYRDIPQQVRHPDGKSHPEGLRLRFRRQGHTEHTAAAQDRVASGAH